MCHAKSLPHLRTCKQSEKLYQCIPLPQFICHFMGYLNGTEGLKHYAARRYFYIGLADVYTILRDLEEVRVQGFKL